MSLRRFMIITLLFIQTTTNVRTQLNDDLWYQSLFLYKMWPENLQGGGRRNNLDERVVVELIKDVDYIQDFVEVGYVNEEPATTQVPEEESELSTTTAMVTESDISTTPSATDSTMESQNASTESTTGTENIIMISEDATNEPTTTITTTTTEQITSSTSIDTLSAIPLPEITSTESPSLANHQKTISFLLLFALAILLQNV